MNCLLGIVISIKSSEEISLVEIRVGKAVGASVLVIDAPEVSPYLLEGKRVSLLFKESEVMIAKGNGADLSVTNRFPARVERIEEHPILSKISLISDGVVLQALLTSKAKRELNLKVGDRVTALVNPTEITLADHS